MLVCCHWSRIKVENMFNAALYGEFERFTAPFAAKAANIAAQCVVSHLEQQESADSARPITVVDAACGTGAATFALLERLQHRCDDAQKNRLLRDGNLSVRPSDINVGMVQSVNSACDVLRANNGGNRWLQAVAPCVVDDLTTLATLPDGSVDVLMCVFGIMFPPDAAACVRSIYRCLAPGGTAVISTWHYYDLLYWRNRLLKELKGIDLDTCQFLQFGQEPYMRQLLEPAFGWDHAHVSCSFVQDAVEMPLRSVVSVMASSPLTAKYGPYDMDACVHVLSKMTGREPEASLLQHGTALIVVVRKPLI